VLIRAFYILCAHVFISLYFPSHFPRFSFVQAEAEQQNNDLSEEVTRLSDELIQSHLHLQEEKSEKDKLLDQTVRDKMTLEQLQEEVKLLQQQEGVGGQESDKKQGSRIDAEKTVTFAPARVVAEEAGENGEGLLSAAGGANNTAEGVESDVEVKLKLKSDISIADAVESEEVELVRQQTLQLELKLETMRKEQENDKNTIESLQEKLRLAEEVVVPLSKKVESVSAQVEELIAERNRLENEVRLLHGLLHCR
jgi:hypothetical protein